MAKWWDTTKRFASNLMPTSFPFAPLIKTPMVSPKDAMKTAEAYVDPSRLIFGRPILPYNPSILVSRKGLSIFDDMKRDEQVKACLAFKKAAILSPGWEVVSPGDEKADWEVTEFVRDNFMRLDRGLPKSLKKILTAQEYGYSVTEKIYASDAEWAPGKLVLSRLSSVKPHYFDFNVSPWGELLNLIQRNVPGGMGIGNPLPPDKFVVYSHDQEFENFYGRSDLEAAYRAWWVKDNVYKWFAVYLERYGMSPLFALYNPNVYQPGQLDELKKVIKGIQNATLGIIPRSGADDLELWSQEISGQSRGVFMAALGRFDADIGKALLVPSLIGAGGDQTSQGEGSKGSYARSKTHFELFLTVVDEERKALAADAINSQLIPQLCDLNWAGLKAYPEFKFLPLDSDTKYELYKLWSELVAGKVVNRIEDDETHIRKALGMPENDNPVLEPLPDPSKLPGDNAPGKDSAASSDAKPKKVPPEEQSAEMKQFAEEHDAVWVYAGDERVAVQRTSLDV